MKTGKEGESSSSSESSMGERRKKIKCRNHSIRTNNTSGDTQRDTHTHSKKKRVVRAATTRKHPMLSLPMAAAAANEWRKKIRIDKKYYLIFSIVLWCGLCLYACSVHAMHPEKVVSLTSWLGLGLDYFDDVTSFWLVYTFISTLGKLIFLLLLLCFFLPFVFGCIFALDVCHFIHSKLIKRPFFVGECLCAFMLCMFLCSHVNVWRFHKLHRCL